MAKHQHFEELPVWQESTRLYNAVLDLIEQPNLALPPAFRNQLERAALSVSNHVAGAFECSTLDDRQSAIADARDSAAEVRSMMALIQERPRIKSEQASLQNIRTLAESCLRQLGGWNRSLEQFRNGDRDRDRDRDRSSAPDGEQRPPRDNQSTSARSFQSNGPRDDRSPAASRSDSGRPTRTASGDDSRPPRDGRSASSYSKRP